jgi:hypothetical protein
MREGTLVDAEANTKLSILVCLRCDAAAAGSARPRDRREVWACPNGHAEWPRNAVMLRSLEQLELSCTTCGERWLATDAQREIIMAALRTRVAERRSTTSRE